MEYLQQLIFLLILGAAVYFLYRRISFISTNIKLGKPLHRTDNTKQRWRNVLLVAFGQKKMFKRPIPALLHLCVYVGFLVINIEVLEFVTDGLLGTHRVFAPYLGGFYNLLMNTFELFAMLVLVSCIIFLIRRNVIKVKRFQSAEMTTWPRLDANLILIVEIALVLAILDMNAIDQILQARGADHYPTTGILYFSSILMPLFESLSTDTLIVLERAFWWFHIIGILSFAVYVTYSKHLHIFLAFPNTYYADLEPAGKMDNMETVTNEVKIMLGVQQAEAGANEIGRFGAKDVMDLSWKSLMDSYTCTECGRCTDECPANQTGKQLSPRKIMMDTRDRLTEIGLNRQNGATEIDETNALLDNYISREEINACTSCNACVEACPVLINPLSIILEMRRFIAMEESGSPADWNAMFQNIETSFAPWKFAPSDRFNWSEKMKS
jgi:heterodisulfide reductase subunit C